MPPFFTRLRFTIAMIVCAILVGCGGKMDSPSEAADRFFALCANGKGAEAYASASGIFQIERSAKYFQARLHDTGLDKFQSVTWTALDATGRVRNVRGDFLLVDDRTIPIIVSMVQDSGRWCLLGAKVEAANGVVSGDIFAVVARSQDSEAESGKAFLEPISTTLPTDRQLQKMVEKILLEFDDGVKRNDFSELYETASDRWKFRGKDPRVLTYAGKDPRMLEKADPENKSRRLTIAALDHAFHTFVDAKVDISRIKGEKMILDEPAYLNSDAVLIVKGRYDTFVFQEGSSKPCKLSFLLEFVYEGSQWLCFGLTLNFAVPDLK